MRGINFMNKEDMKEFVKLVLDETILYFKKWNPTIQEFHVSLIKIIFDLCNFYPLLKKIFIFLLNNMFRGHIFLSATLIFIQQMIIETYFFSFFLHKMIYAHSINFTIITASINLAHCQLNPPTKICLSNSFIDFIPII